MDYLNPIIADADTGHGGLTATMKRLGSKTLRGLVAERALAIFVDKMNEPQC